MTTRLVVVQTGDWKRVLRITGPSFGPRFRRAIRTAVDSEAKRAKKLFITGLRSGAPAGQAFTPHSPITLAIRRARGGRGSRGGKILIEGGGMLRGIGIVRQGSGVFIGVRASAGAKSRNGRTPLWLAMLHHQGASFSREMTDRQRRFLFWAMRRGGLLVSRGIRQGSGISITIPPRPFITPILDKHFQIRDVAERITRSIATSMGGDLGTA